MSSTKLTTEELAMLKAREEAQEGYEDRMRKHEWQSNAQKALREEKGLSHYTRGERYAVPDQIQKLGIDARTPPMVTTLGERLITTARENTERAAELVAEIDALYYLMAGNSLEYDEAEAVDCYPEAGMLPMLQYQIDETKTRLRRLKQVTAALLSL